MVVSSIIDDPKFARVTINNGRLDASEAIVPISDLIELLRRIEVQVQLANVE
jgi:hypothetical protein